MRFAARNTSVVGRRNVKSALSCVLIHTCDQDIRDRNPKLPFLIKAFDEKNYEVKLKKKILRGINKILQIKTTLNKTTLNLILLELFYDFN